MAGTALFCDDIRLEASGQTSLIGCYAGQLIVHHAWPVTLPKLAVMALVDAPRAAPPREIVLRIVLDPGDTLLFETRVEATRDEPSDTAELEESPDAIVRIGLNVVLGPLAIEQESRLRVRAVVDGAEIKLGSLKIVSAPPDEPG
ncbi:hypothetical protein GCM10011322_12890 [Salinarimonas ramus]|uniref:Uncharacterized protein n=2 Tax=Salinarimonas ramus TaxID=690164 RepID=A0A917Q5U9_9HYPH|nr:hypothetical protein GCM10011322_12890 [Salinarimonas ramus]